MKLLQFERLGENDDSYLLGGKIIRLASVLKYGDLSEVI